MPQDGTPVVLLAEDSFDDVLLIRRAFRKEGLSVRIEAVEDGEIAVDYLAGNGPYSDREAHPWPALMLLDLKMPRKDGLEVLKWIRAEPRMGALPVIVLTSSHQPEDIARAYAAGANSFVQKPHEFEALRHFVRQLSEYWLKINLPTAYAFGPGRRSGPPWPSS